ncbi:MAG: UDP-N-acetylmuramyl-tripeptide synthetase [Candidatus Treponema excrementipullorum]|nr:UDP-N-acetylmuramyl-tripeptide synthetase [Spirochaetia bacterium]MDD7013328.1 UDP-N-acetylmuramyl-tripeptide synthetase [Candidatus Treponema excrementipullorum]MDY4706855.1 UDP-N-acetylmuramyl-tripeptide synthetase [Candidatus Treponema excrementipullorum]
MEKKLSQLVNALNIELTSVDRDPVITDLCFDSRSVTSGSLFFALPGTHVHGNTFITDAINRGALAVVYQDELPVEAVKTAKSQQTAPVFIKVQDARFAMSPIAAAFYDNPSSKLAVIGVTGTEGKSSTVSFIWQLLRLMGKKAGFFSTVQYSLGGDAIANPEHQTTPEAPIVQRQLYQMVQAGCHYAVVESSSHGLSVRTNRLGNVLFDCAVWMNVTHEHLEFHGTFEQYRHDKANLFRALDTHNHEKLIDGQKVTIPAFGVINLEDPSAEYFVKSTKYPVYGFTTRGAAGRGQGFLNSNPPRIPYLLADKIAGSKGISFELEGSEKLIGTVGVGSIGTVGVGSIGTVGAGSGTIAVETPVSGAFNVYNITAALLTVSQITQLPIQEVAGKTQFLAPITGRMTPICQGQPFEVIVDYAHTPSSFETIFPPLKKRVTGRLIALFGSGGERDIKKRPEQGKIAAHWCDMVFLADEDPRGEDPQTLLEMIAQGARTEGKVSEETGLYLIPNRQEAIRKAFSLAREGDIILLLGKAHENSIIYKDYIMPYDEIKEAQNALAEMGFKSR